jgi:hypothetical protein
MYRVEHNIDIGRAYINLVSGHTNIFCLLYSLNFKFSYTNIIPHKYALNCCIP